MATLKLTSPADVPAVVDAFLGFTPADSLVVLGLGGGPTARVDISPDTIGDAVRSLAPAVPHWSRVIVALYSDLVSIAEVEVALSDILTSVELVAIVAVDTHDVVTDHEGNRHKPQRPEGLPARTVRPSRDSLLADAERVTSPSVAWSTAVESYLAGDGAKAWVYRDRFVALNGSETAPSLHLEVLLEQAVDPKSVMGQTIVGR